jgi:hypothetical protein
LDVRALVVPQPQPGHREPVPEIVRSQRLAIVKARELAGLSEVALQAGCRQTAASRAEEERLAFGPGKHGVALTGVSTKFGCLGRWVNRNQAVFTELGFTDEDAPVGQIDVAAIKPDHFARS